MSLSAPRFDYANLWLRLRSALILIPVTLAALWLGGAAWGALVVIMTVIGLYEWRRLVRAMPHRTTSRHMLWSVLGLFYLGGSAWALLYLRALPASGQYQSLFLLLTVWASDVGAFISGRLIGGPKLAPAISPGKTWAGLGGGMCAAGAVGLVTASSLDAAHPLTGLVLAAGLAVVGQAGDLFESFVKRRAGVKDSGRIIPGHGGVLDRIDALAFAGIVLAAFDALCEYGSQWW